MIGNRSTRDPSDAGRRDYAAALTDPRWQRKRLEIMQRDGWACTRCGDAESQLHVHHSAYNGKPWECPDSAMFTLCHECHSKQHSEAWTPGRYDGDPFWRGPLTRWLSPTPEPDPWRVLPNGDVIPPEDEWGRDESKEVSDGWWVSKSGHDGFIGCREGTPGRYPGGAGCATHRQVCEWVADRMTNSPITVNAAQAARGQA